VYGRISRLRFAIIRRSDQNVANRYESTVPLIYDRRSLAPRNQSGSDSVTSGLKILTFLLYAERFTGALEYLERGVGLKDEYRALQKTSRKRGRTREYAPRYVASDAIHAFEGDLDSGVVSPPGIERGSAGGTALEASTSKIAATVSDVCTRRCNTRRVHGIPSCSSASDKSHRGEGEGEGGGGYCRYPALLAASAVLLTVDGNTITLLFERVRRVLHYSLARRVSLSLSLSLSLSWKPRAPSRRRKLVARRTRQPCRDAFGRVFGLSRELSPLRYRTIMPPIEMCRSPRIPVSVHGQGETDLRDHFRADCLFHIPLLPSSNGISRLIISRR